MAKYFKNGGLHLRADSKCADSTGGPSSAIASSTLVVHYSVHTFSTPILYWSGVTVIFISHRGIFAELPYFTTQTYVLENTNANSQSVGKNSTLPMGIRGPLISTGTSNYFRSEVYYINII